MSKDYKPFLRDMQRLTQALQQYSAPLSRETLGADQVLFEAILYNLLVLGEAARRIPEEIRSRHSEVNWRGIVGTRSFIIHEYDSVDLDIVWNILSVQIPILSAQIENVIASEGT